MPRRKTNPEKTAQPSRRRRGFIRRITHSTLFAAGLAAAQFGDIREEAESPLFDVTLVDRLQVTITRHHD